MRRNELNGEKIPILLIFIVFYWFSIAIHRVMKIPPPPPLLPLSQSLARGIFDVGKISNIQPNSFCFSCFFLIFKAISCFESNEAFHPHKHGDRTFHQEAEFQNWAGARQCIVVQASYANFELSFLEVTREIFGNQDWHLQSDELFQIHSKRFNLIFSLISSHSDHLPLDSYITEHRIHHFSPTTVKNVASLLKSLSATTK